jgi:hypothetical protein
LSLPISTIGAVAGAAKIAQGIASGISRGVSEAIGFHDVLSGGEQPSPAVRATGLVEAIEDRLSRAGIDVNQELPIRVTDDGKIRVEADHPRAAEIELLLNSDPQIGNLAGHLSGTAEANGLTIRGDQGNILPSSGGYPNW